jgi:hypothetical protein
MNPQKGGRVDVCEAIASRWQLVEIQEQAQSSLSDFLAGFGRVE